MRCMCILSFLPCMVRGSQIRRARGRGMSWCDRSMPNAAGEYSSSLSFPPSLYVLYACAPKQANPLIVSRGKLPMLVTALHALKTVKLSSIAILNSPTNEVLELKLK